MEPFPKGKPPIVYKWLSWLLLLAFAYYWLLTFGLVLFSKTVSARFPHQTVLYRTFARQNWRLFAISKVYNRQMLLVTRSIQNPAATDTTDIVQYFLAIKRDAAPFNNYEDAMDRILYIVMNGVEMQMINYKKTLQQQNPNKPASFYLAQCSALVEADARQEGINNIVAFAKYMLKKKKISTAGKEYQLIITHKFIQPSSPPSGSVANGSIQTIFASTFKPF